MDADDVSQATLERADIRAFTFLGAASDPAINAQLATRGYMAAEHSEGWRLVLQWRVWRTHSRRRWPAARDASDPTTTIRPAWRRPRLRRSG